MNFRVLRTVREEIVAAAMWFEGKADGLGVEFLDLVDAELAKIEANPFSFPAWEHNFVNAEIRRAILQRFDYVIYYQLVQDETVVVSVSHGSRDCESWIKRIRYLDS